MDVRVGQLEHHRAAREPRNHLPAPLHAGHAHHLRGLDVVVPGAEVVHELLVALLCIHAEMLTRGDAPDGGRRRLLVGRGERVCEERGRHQGDRGHEHRQHAHTNEQRTTASRRFGLRLDLEQAPVCEGVEAREPIRCRLRFVPHLDPDLVSFEEHAAAPGRNDERLRQPAGRRRRAARLSRTGRRRRAGSRRSRRPVRGS